MIKKIAALFISSCSILNAYAQETILPVNPQANQLANANKEAGAENIYSVDPFTGIGGVNIPIYDYSVDGINLGVSLVYNAKGIKVDDISSSIGLGWDLNVGGSITREVFGGEDEFMFDRVAGNNNFPALRGNWVEYVSSVTVEKDREPDIFTVNLAGRTFKMAIQYKDSNTIWIEPRIFTEPKSEIMVKFHVYFGGILQTTAWERPPLSTFGLSGSLPNTPMNPNTYIDFTIIDEKGNQFYFTRGEYQHVLYDESPTLQPALMYSTQKWVLKQVKTFTGAVVNYNYQTSWVNYPLYSKELVRESKISNSIDSVATETEMWNGRIAQLKSIEYPNGVTVNFHIDSTTDARCDLPGAHVVDSIEIVSQYENSCANSLTYVLNHSYYHTPHGNNGATTIAHRASCQTISGIGGDKYVRLRLDSIQRVGTDHYSKERYFAFTYNSTPLPQRLSPQKDYYGYYNNGTVTPLTFNGNPYNLGIPYHTFQMTLGSTSYGTDRATDATTNLDYIRAGLLTKLKNAYNGEIEFVYKKPVLYNPNCSYGDHSYNNNRPQYSYVEPNGSCDIDPELLGSGESDGLVIDNIILRDGFSSANDQVVRYTYSDGQRFFKGGYFWYLTKTMFGEVERYWVNFPVSDQKYFNGSNHGFSNVTITRENPNTSEVINKTELIYTNLIMDRSMFDSTTNAVYNSAMTGNWKSNLEVKTGLYYHNVNADFQQCYLGLLRQSKEYGPNNTLISSTTNKYGFSPYSTTYYTDSAGTPKGVQNFYFHKFYHYDSINASSPYNLLPKYLESNEPGFSNGMVYLSGSTITNQSGSTGLTTDYQYEYDNKYNIKSITWKNSKGEAFKKEFDYTYDIGFCNNCLSDTVQHRVYERLINVTKNKVINHSVLRPVIISHDSLYHNWNNRIMAQLRFPYVYKSTINGGIDYSTALSDEISAYNLNTGLSSLKRVKEYTLFDSHNNVLETKYLDQDNYSCSIWDTRIGKKIADISNAHYNEIAYTSFEGLGSNSVFTDYDKGNWELNPSAVVLYNGSQSAQPATGRYMYDITQGNLHTKNTLQTDKTYILTFWSGDAPKVYFDNTPGNLITLNQQTSAISGLTLFTAVVVGNGDKLTIAPPDLGNIPFIDEVRLYPDEAAITTYTYEPLFDVNSVCDERNNITRYEYDKFGRQITVRNTKREIVSHKNIATNSFNY